MVLILTLQNLTLVIGPLLFFFIIFFIKPISYY
jgi:hypothetical protein